MTRVIAFDGSILAAGPVTGVAGSFLTTLASYARRTPYRCVLLTPPTAVSPALAGVEVQSCLATGRWRRPRSLRIACHRLRADLLHCPVTAVPTRNPCPTIATVHDLPWLYDELRAEAGSRLLRRLALHLAARTAAAILVPSQATRADLDRYVRIDDSRVHVVHHGLPPVPDPAPMAALTGAFLVLGDDRPRKNLSRLRRAHARAVGADRTLPALRCVGPGHGYLDDAEKWQVLRQSRALLHVSLLEGFGLPVLEAFAHGVPVVCSNTTSLPEVARDAALQVDPGDEAAIAAALVRIHQDAGLRATLRERGRQRAAQLTPAGSAAGWLRVHRSVLGDRD